MVSYTILLWPLSLKFKFVRFILIVVASCTLLFFPTVSYFTGWLNHSLFIHSTINWYLGFFFFGPLQIVLLRALLYITCLLVHMYINILSIELGMELLNCRVCMCLDLVDSFKELSKEVIPMSIPISNKWEFWILHILLSTQCFLMSSF